MTSRGRGSAALVRVLLPGVAPAMSSRGRRRQLAAGIPTPTLQQAWLLLAVLGRSLPLSSEVEAARRLARHQGMPALLASIARARRRPAAWFRRSAEIIDDAVLLDVNDTATTQLATGVQRVAREVALDWAGRPGVELVGWSASRDALLRLDADRFRLKQRRGVFRPGSIVPLGGHYVLAESLTEPARALRIQAIADYSGAVASMIGHDVIPLTMAETTGPGMPGVFAKYLAAASRMHRVAATSGASTTEFLGWKRMLASAGLAGPTIVTVPLAASVPRFDPALEAGTRERLSAAAGSDLPLVLCVGSHEPRKNHLAVLQAAELLWSAGEQFSLSFVGGNSWSSEAFANTLDRMRAAGRPVQSVSGMSDGQLWWAYRLARLTVFPSLGEGFGLPVAESLYAGTPVVTSDFGSMAELASLGGCVLVDPRDDTSIAAGIRSLLVDEPLHARLSAQASTIRPRSWADYADELWHAMVN